MSRSLPHRAAALLGLTHLLSQFWPLWQKLRTFVSPLSDGKHQSKHQQHPRAFAQLQVRAGNLSCGCSLGKVWPLDRVHTACSHSPTAAALLCARGRHTSHLCTQGIQCCNVLWAGIIFSPKVKLSPLTTQPLKLLFAISEVVQESACFICRFNGQRCPLSARNARAESYWIVSRLFWWVTIQTFRFLVLRVLGFQS